MQKGRLYFDSVADRWDQMVYHDPGKLEQFFRWIALKKGERVLDVGTGTGVLIPYIHRCVGREGEIYAVDFSGEMLKRARKKYPFPNVKYVQSDINDFQVADIGFDAVICYSVFPHFRDQKAVVRHLAFGVNEGGRLVICHSQSREEINALHKKKEDMVGGAFLPPACDIALMMEESGLCTEYVVDNENVFFVMGKKG